MNTSLKNNFSSAICDAIIGGLATIFTTIWALDSDKRINAYTNLLQETAGILRFTAVDKVGYEQRNDQAFGAFYVAWALSKDEDKKLIAELFSATVLEEHKRLAQDLFQQPYKGMKGKIEFLSAILGESNDSPFLDFKERKNQ